MKNFNSLIVSFLFLFVVVSCTNREKSEIQNFIFPKTIYLNLSNPVTDTMNLSDMADKVEYVPLQTTDSSLMGYFYDFAITKDYIFIKNELSILKFDNTGRFINSIFKVGRGPREAGARSFTVDETGELVYVFDHFVSKIKIYDFNGMFINTIKKQIAPPEYWIWSIGFFNNRLFISTTQRPMIKYLYSAFDLKNDSIRIIYKNYRNYDKSQEKQWPAIIPNDYNYQITDSCIMFKEKFCDTIFKVNNKFIPEARYIINLDNRKLEWEGWRDHGMFNLTDGLPFGYSVRSFRETKTSLLMVLESFKEPELFTFYDKRTDSVKIFANKNDKRTNNQVYLRNDLDYLVPFPPMNQDGFLFYYDGWLYSVIEAKDFVDGYKSASPKTRNSTKYLKSMAPVFSTINEFNNPIIMKVHLK